VPAHDDFGRAISYLRVSVTDRCNLRCVYCMPPDGIEKRLHSDILRYEELALVVRAAVGLGISSVRLTGGEPLARIGLADFIRMLAAIPGLADLSLTTNGTLLAPLAQALAAAGLRRVNISLDTLRPERFLQITRRNGLDDVLAGIEAAQDAGLSPIKLNMVVVRGQNEDEIVDFAQRTITHAWHVRFIELMPMGANRAGTHEDCVVPIPETRAAIEAQWGPLEAVRGPTGNGPARYYRLAGAAGTVGFIGAQSDHFCSSCNRLRLTADGRLRPCLLNDQEINLRGELRSGAGMERIQEIVAQAIRSKPLHHRLDEDCPPQGRTMAQIGG
jgi:cyclic pyranopterin phosphate synthase